MNLAEIIIEALNTLKVNKMRTILAVLGIVIGIGSVIALISLGQASQQSITNQIESLGSNLLTVISKNSITTLTYDDAKAIMTSSKINTVSKVSPEVSKRSQVVTGQSNTNTTIYGVTPVYSEIKKIEIANGLFITQRDLESMGKVAVLGPQVVEDLFGDATKNVVGQSVRIDKQTFKIIGVTKEKGGSGMTNQDDMVYVPLTTAMKVLYGQNYLSSISVEAKSSEVMVQAQDEVGYLLLERHKLTDPTKADFRIMNMSDVLSTVSSVTGTFTSLLSGIAAISLLVGGIGIMNIMLVTVTERTREVGLRKALGAKKKAIIYQFLTEAILLTVIGGILGMILGIGISYILSKTMSLPFTISISSIALAIGVSGIIGVVFGWYPAKKASDLQPIEALRYE
ncbi:MAG: ABC transporter permease [Patescibacteria group bacterium]